jgi:hypothetical protein
MNRFVATIVAAVTASVASAAVAVPVNRDASVLNSFPKGAALPWDTNTSSVGGSGEGGTNSVNVNLAGFQTFDGGFPGALNTSLVVPIVPFAQITAISFSNLQISLENGSFGSEFVISTNDSANAGTGGTFWDYRPFDTATNSDTPVGPASGSFTNPSNQFVSGPFTLLADGNLLLYVYETFNDAGASRDALVDSGTLTITYIGAPIPEPVTLGIVTAGGALLLKRRRRA